ncbi:uncharacterized protein METZ01_LOCUS142083 [marine metagenome]|uniref:nucleoside-diphosphate kinase n=1 Tax=marine metagenome TaxID=408172 RepID=A0A381ZJ61_9ZZZZ
MSEAWLNTSIEEGVNTRTLVLIKPKGLSYWMKIKEILLTAAPIYRTRLMLVTRDLIREHYEEHSSKPFFNQLTEYFVGKYVLAVELLGAPRKIREIIGPTNPADNEHENTIRGMLGQLVPPDSTLSEFTSGIDNLIHGADSETAATRELKLWFDCPVGPAPTILSLTRHSSRNDAKNSVFTPFINVDFPLEDPKKLLTHVTDFIEALPWLTDWSEAGEKLPKIRVGGPSQIAPIVIDYLHHRTGKLPTICWVYADSDETFELDMKLVKDRARRNR